MTSLQGRVVKAVVDHTRCGGIGLCEATAPKVFEVGDHGQARVLVGEVPAEELPAVREAVENCPTAALSIHD